MLLVSTGRDGRGRGRERTAVTTRPGEWQQVARWSGPSSLPSDFRVLFFVPGGRRDARPGRPVVLRAVRPECPAGAPRSRAGPADVPLQSGRERQGVSGLRPLPRL